VSERANPGASRKNLPGHTTNHSVWNSEGFHNGVIHTLNCFTDTGVLTFCFTVLSKKALSLSRSIAARTEPTACPSENDIVAK